MLKKLEYRKSVIALDAEEAVCGESLRAVVRTLSHQGRVCAGEAALLFAAFAMLVVSDTLPFLKDKLSVKELFRFGKFANLSRSL